ncbi:MAG TPA: exonuclease SbcCD subunit D [Blastocatellia bacterium]|nr:exonuclease SbcCD subunit D [Blastocatellia bacterium]
MPRFLHIADVHLGIRRYNLPDRTTDFFRAWREVIERHAIARRVDFVLIAGDLFDQRKVDPQAANHAMIVLRELGRHQIPAIVIEGNHDQHEATTRHSWLRSFSQWRHIKLLEPDWNESGELCLRPWDDASASGSFIDIGGARIFGSTWYGATIAQTLPLLASAVREKRRPGATNIMLLHSDIEGQLNRPIPCALSISKLAVLRAAVDYLALGHTHKRFEIDGWAFNPGSLEACNVDEACVVRGAYLVESEGATIKPEFLQAGKDYFQRPFKRIDHQISGDDQPEDVRSALLDLLQAECAGLDAVDPDDKPIVEITLRGQLGFKNSLLKLDKIKEDALERFQPMGLMINNKTMPKQLAVATGLGVDVSRGEREVRIIEDLLKPDSRFAGRAAELAALIVDLKRLTLEKEGPEKLFDLIEHRLFDPENTPAPEPGLAFAAVSASGLDGRGIQEEQAANEEFQLIGEA